MANNVSSVLTRQTRQQASGAVSHKQSLPVTPRTGQWHSMSIDSPWPCDYARLESRIGFRLSVCSLVLRDESKRISLNTMGNKPFGPRPVF